jgi:hypothetical protein
MTRATLLLLLFAGTADARPSVGLVIGSGAFFGHEDIDITRTTAIGFQGLFPLRGRLDLVVGFDGFTGNYSPEPTNEQSVINVTCGLRWFPYARTHRNDLEARAVYVQAAIGASLLTLIPYDSFFETNDPDAAGLVAAGTLGWMPMHQGNVSIGFEARGQAILFNNDFGLREALSVNAVFELDFE